MRDGKSAKLSAEAMLAVLAAGPMRMELIAEKADLHRWQLYEGLQFAKNRNWLHVPKYEQILVVVRGNDVLRWVPVYASGPGKSVPMPRTDHKKRARKTPDEKAASVIAALSKPRAPAGNAKADPYHLPVSFFGVAA